MHYNLAFTIGALYYDESGIYIDEITDLTSYLNKKSSPSHSVIPINAETSQKKVKGELDKRFRHLNQEYLSEFRKASPLDRKIILFLAICKTYRILVEFCLEVVYKKWRRFDHHISTYDFKYFLSLKLTDEQYDSLTDTTMEKLAQVGIRIIKEVGLLDDEGIHPLTPSNTLKNIIIKSKDEWFFDCLLISN